MYLAVDRERPRGEEGRKEHAQLRSPLRDLGQG